MVALLGDKFFSPCVIHDTAKKNEKNIFCLDCCYSICAHCLSLHRSHRLIQIRRYVYHDVVRLDDMEKLIDCSLVQSYSTNNAKVIFLNQRPQSRPFRGSGNVCSICDRSLQDPYIFCSLACKVSNLEFHISSFSLGSSSKFSVANSEPLIFLTRVSSSPLQSQSQVQHLVKRDGGLSKYLYECEFLPFGDSTCYELEDGQMTPDSILDSPVSFGVSSGSSSSDGGECRTLACTATTEFVRKKRSNVSSRAAHRPPAVAAAAQHMNRRKGTPNRSPLY
ncbi:hypothetical protein ACLOJK_005500 [Asimina triloba]